ncbi:hypothetical protein ONA70_35635 [Micromonospora yasonensis]|uniref:hypothetical protein n=1 Tax=Micromonospora yasonensis TaxID=1128667 RepID=UPI00222ED171|nr:hypothetical protein [Micromonospora yasonensis]MCW3845409.1 hypothetical protein [Micromonospora yasonensis]
MRRNGSGGACQAADISWISAYSRCGWLTGCPVRKFTSRAWTTGRLSRPPCTAGIWKTGTPLYLPGGASVAVVVGRNATIRTPGSGHIRSLR